MSQDRIQNNDSRQTTPRSSIPTPNVANILNRTQQATNRNRVTHGANEQYFDGITGKAVGQIRKSLREVFNIPGDAEALVDGKVVGDDFVLQAGQDLEFNKSAGEKGGGNSTTLYMWTTLVLFVLVLLSLLHTVLSLLTLHFLQAFISGAWGVFCGILFKLSLNRFTEAEQSTCH